jgi:hypothetical protein
MRLKIVGFSSFVSHFFNLLSTAVKIAVLTNISLVTCIPIHISFSTAIQLNLGFLGVYLR